MDKNPPSSPDQKPTYFIVPQQQFQEHVNRLGRLSYIDVAGILQEFLNASRAMFDPIPKFKGPGGQVVTDPPAPADPPGDVKGNGADQPGDKTATPPGETLPDAQDEGPEVDPDPPTGVDKPVAGGAE